LVRGFESGHYGDNRPFASGTPARADDFAKHLMTKHGDGRLAGRQAVLREQFGNRPIRGALLSEFGDDFLGRDQILELFWTARRKLRDRLPNGGWIKRGHTHE
jgi:hypothetical protein